jgi:FixJ family two-component response regulator
MSGYAQTILDTQGALDADINLLEKPFSENDLLTQVRHAINHDASAPDSPLPAETPEPAQTATRVEPADAPKRTPAPA